MRKTSNTAPKCNKSTFFNSNFVLSKFNILKIMYIFCPFLVWFLQKEVQGLLVEIRNSNKQVIILHTLRKLINICLLSKIDRSKNIFCFGTISGYPRRSCDSFRHYLRSAKIEGRPFSTLITPIYSPLKCNLFLLKQSYFQY